jgi:hypothetical protein
MRRLSPRRHTYGKKPAETACENVMSGLTEKDPKVAIKSIFMKL